MVTRLTLNAPGTPFAAATDTAFAEARAAQIFRAVELAHIDTAKWLDSSVATLEGVSPADAQVLAARRISTLRDLALLPPAVTDDLAPALSQRLSHARTVIRAAAERHAILLAG